jgi:nucleotide-binding universal stress UspA family protein
MERHLLLTVSELKSCVNGIRFLGRFFSNKEDMALTLFYAAPKPPAVWEGERTYKRTVESEREAGKIEARARKVLADTGRELCRLGFREDQIRAKLQIRRFSKVMDIIQEGEKGLYDAVVLGRRGLSWLEEAFDESTSRGILQQRMTFPLWLSRNPDPERQNVLLCIDGSEPSYRMADHVGFILAPERSQKVTLLFVKKSGSSLKESSEAVLSKGKEHLLTNGFQEDLVSIKTLEAGNVVKTVLREAKEGRFAVVAMGRSGTGTGLLQKIFMGSVSDALFRELKKAALWISY